MEWSGVDLSGVTFGGFFVKTKPFQNVVLSGRAKKPQNVLFAELLLLRKIDWGLYSRPAHGDRPQARGPMMAHGAQLGPQTQKRLVTNKNM